MNFYYSNLQSTNDNAGGFSQLPGTESAFSIYSLRSDFYSHQYLELSLTHQVCHNLSLYHTYEIGTHLLPDDPRVENSGCEHVTRDNTNANYNADYAGDEVEDTPAQPLVPTIDWPYDCSPLTLPSMNCFLEEYSVPFYRNYMNISGQDENPCAYNLTPGQIVRMRTFIANNQSEFNYNNLETVRTDIENLYEPFYTQVVAGDIVSVVDQPENGGALVCRAQKYRLRFQPGFNCEFSGTSNGTVVQTTADQFNYDNNFDTAIGVKIPILDNSVHNVGVISSVSPFLCTLEKYIGGMLISTAVLGSMDITVEDLNEIRVRNPNLFDELMAQYYYNLQRWTASGARIDLFFYKY